MSKRKAISRTKIAGTSPTTNGVKRLPDRLRRKTNPCSVWSMDCVEAVIEVTQQRLKKASAGEAVELPWHDNEIGPLGNPCRLWARGLITLVVAPNIGPQHFSEQKRQKVDALHGEIADLPFDAQFRQIVSVRLGAGKTLAQMADAVIFHGMPIPREEFASWLLKLGPHFTSAGRMLAEDKELERAVVAKLGKLTYTEQALVLIEITGAKTNLNSLAERSKWRPAGGKAPHVVALGKVNDLAGGKDILQKFQRRRRDRCPKGTDATEAADADYHATLDCEDLSLIFIKLQDVKSSKLRARLSARHVADADDLRNFLTALFAFSLGRNEAWFTSDEASRGIARIAAVTARGKSKAEADLIEIAAELLRRDRDLIHALLVQFNSESAVDLLDFLSELFDRWHEAANDAGLRMDRLLAGAHLELSAYPCEEVADLSAIKVIDPKATAGRIKGRRQRLGLSRRAKRPGWTDERRQKTVAARKKAK